MAKLVALQAIALFGPCICMEGDSYLEACPADQVIQVAISRRETVEWTPKPVLRMRYWDFAYISGTE
jgi:hypothetical protein